MQNIFSNPLHIAIAACFAAMIAVDFLNARFFASPKLFLLKRWLRCVFFSIAIGLLLSALLPEKPVNYMLFCGLLIYIFFETLLYWININAASVSECARPRQYESIDNAWRPERRFIKLKEKIFSLGFTQEAAMVSKIDGTPVIYQTCFDSSDRKTRLSVAFILHGGVWITASSAYSKTDNGDILYTEAIPLAFGLRYPKKFKVSRFPMIENPLKIVKIHTKRVKARKDSMSEILSDPMEDSADTMHEIEEYNRKIGLVSADINSDEYFTEEGKYNIWKDMILINYFPFMAR